MNFKHLFRTVAFMLCAICCGCETPNKDPRYSEIAQKIVDQEHIKVLAVVDKSQCRGLFENREYPKKIAGPDGKKYVVSLTLGYEPSGYARIRIDASGPDGKFGSTGWELECRP